MSVAETTLRRFGPYIATGLIVLLGALAWYRPWSMPAGAIASTGGDGIALQATYQLVAQSGIVGVNEHLAWSAGYNPWFQPQWGFLVFIGAWVLGMIGFGSATSLVIVQIVLLILLSLSALYLFRACVGRRIPVIAVCFAVALSLSSYYLEPGGIGHQGVTAVFAIPLILAVLIRGRGRSRRWWVGACVAIALIALLSPLWWILVLFVLLGTAMIGLLVARQVRHVYEVIATILAVAVGTLPQLYVYSKAKVVGEETTRSAWDSNHFGGHLVDIFAGSPLLRLVSGRFTELAQGASAELRDSGLILGLFAAACLLLLLKGFATSVRFRQIKLDSRFLSAVSVAAILAFLAGGLGNLQAAVAVFGGTASPGRVWSRLIVVVALLGMVWVLIYLARWWESREDARRGATALLTCTVLVAGVFGIAELRYVGHFPWTAPEKTPEYPAVSYIAASIPNCPIAQLPVDSTPIPRLTTMKFTDVEQFYYRGYTPYVLEPNSYWSFGSWVRGSTTLPNNLPETLGPGAATQLKAAGFCGVLFDKRFADVIKERSVKQIPGVEVAALGAPSFDSRRYSVYVLK